MAITDMKEQSDLIFLNLIQNFSSYILSDPDTNQIHVGPITYQVGTETSLQPVVSVHHCKSKLTLVDTTYIFHACHNFINFLYTIEDMSFPYFL